MRRRGSVCGSLRSSALAAFAVLAGCGVSDETARVRLALDLGEHRAALEGACETDGLFSLPACPVFVELTVSGDGLSVPPVRWPKDGAQLNEAGEFVCGACSRAFSSMAALGGHRRFCDGGAWRWMRTHALCSDQLRSRTHAFAQPFDLSRWSE